MYTFYRYHNVVREMIHESLVKQKFRILLYITYLLYNYYIYYIIHRII